MKFAVFTSHNPDFSVLQRCCILKYTDWCLGKTLRRNTRVLTITNERLQLW